MLTEMVQELKALNLKVTLWIHPFINFSKQRNTCLRAMLINFLQVIFNNNFYVDCSSFQTAVSNGYFVKDDKGRAGLTMWWQSRGSPSGVIDFTNTDAVSWWTRRLESLQSRYGIDSFKFDAGETNWLPYSSKLNGDLNLQPNLYTTKFVEALAKFGGMIEVRSGRRSQVHYNLDFKYS